MNKKIDFAVGGQALIEGVMMRSPNFITAAVRKPDGTITLKEEPFKSIGQKIKFLSLPLMRGVVNLFEMMIIGVRMLNYSAEESMNEEEEKDKKEKGSGIFSSVALTFSILFSLAFSIFLFKFIPLWVTDWLSHAFPLLEKHYILYNLVDGVLKTSLFILYIAFITLLPGINRVFQYHGAEHKSIFTYEKGLPLTVENARKQTRFHPRCGTSFIIIVFFISVIFYTFLPKNDVFALNFGIRLLFLPLVAGFSYEFLKWSAKKSGAWYMNFLIAPGLWFQRLTTKEPDDKQLEVALESLGAALKLEKGNSHEHEKAAVLDIPKSKKR